MASISSFIPDLKTPTNITSISILLILILYVRHKLTFWKRQGIPNVIMHTINVFRGVIPIADLKCIQKHGKIVGTYELIWPTLLVAEPELINKILIQNFHDYSGHRVWAQPHQHMGKSLFMLPYETWKPSRSIMSPVFTNGNIRKMKYIFDDSVNSLLNNLRKLADDGKTVDIKPYFESFTMDVLASAFFATKVDSINDSNNPVVSNSRKMFSGDLSLSQMLALFSPLLTKIFGLNALNKQSCDFLAQLSLRIIEERKTKNIERNDLIQYLLDAGNESIVMGRRASVGVVQSRRRSSIMAATQILNRSLSSEEIKDNCIMFFMAAFDTTTSALCHLAYFLTINPEAQDKIIEELDKFYDEFDPDFETLNKMVFLEACIHEALRLIPSLPRIERKTPADCHLGKVFVPKDTYVSIPIYAVHHDPDNYEDPEEFKPERFLPENRHKIKPGTYLPFADGPRNCLGMKFALHEIKFSMSKVLRNFKFVQVKETENLEFYAGQPVILAKSIMLKVEHRKC